MLVILLNCVTLGMFHPCEDIKCDSERCKILAVRLHFLFRGGGSGVVLTAGCDNDECQNNRNVAL